MQIDCRKYGVELAILPRCDVLSKDVVVQLGKAFRSNDENSLKSAFRGTDWQAHNFAKSVLELEQIP